MTIKSKISKVTALAAAAAATSVLALAAPADAATNTTGSVGRLACGWHAVDNDALPGLPYKVTTADLPTVTGTSNASQLVWARVNFGAWGNNGVSLYRSGWFYTSARYGVRTDTWTAYNNGQQGIDFTDDALGESGFASGDGGSQFTVVRVDLYWQSPANSNATVGSYSGWETNARATSYSPYVCNAGANYA